MNQRSRSEVGVPRRSLLADALDGDSELVPVSGSDRAPRAFCGIGVCLECETEIDGRIVRACLVEAPR